MRALVTSAGMARMGVDSSSTALLARGAVGSLVAVYIGVAADFDEACALARVLTALEKHAYVCEQGYVPVVPGEVRAQQRPTYG